MIVVIVAAVVVVVAVVIVDVVAVVYNSSSCSLNSRISTNVSNSSSRMGCNGCSSDSNTAVSVMKTCSIFISSSVAISHSCNCINSKLVRIQ